MWCWGLSPDRLLALKVPYLPYYVPDHKVSLLFIEDTGQWSERICLKCPQLGGPEAMTLGAQLWLLFFKQVF